MAYIQVYVEIDDFSDEEVIGEFEYRLLNKAKREKFEKALRKSGFVLESEVKQDFEVSSPIDELKRDLLVDAFKTYTLEELEERLK